MFQFKISLNYSVNKDLDIRLIYPPTDEANPGLNYPNSCIAIKLRSNNMPFNLVETLTKKSENMIKKLATDPEGGKPQVIPVF